MEKYALDSFALLAFYQKEKGGAVVKSLLEKARDRRATLFLSELTLGETYYISIRARGRETAQKITANILALPITIVPVKRADILAAAEIKSRAKISYADSFVIQLARNQNAGIVTGDPEFRPFAKSLKILWL